MKIVYSHSDKNAGARQIDYQLFGMLSEEFLKKYGCDPRDGVRQRLRLLDSIEKARKLLSGNKEADIVCEALMEDNDLRRHISRDDFESLISPSVAKFKETLDQFVA